jgi:endonuclease YncB( thermonuclease family)
VQARVLKVIDGDTIVVRARIWLGQDVETRVRLAGVDAPELRGACLRERALAQAARKRIAEMIDGAVVKLNDIRQDKFGGRVVADVRTVAGDDLAALLIAHGLARAYDGGTRASWCGGAATGP